MDPERRQAASPRSPRTLQPIFSRARFSLLVLAAFVAAAFLDGPAAQEGRAGQPSLTADPVAGLTAWGGTPAARAGGRTDLPAQNGVGRRALVSPVAAGLSVGIVAPRVVAQRSQTASPEAAMTLTGIIGDGARIAIIEWRGQTEIAGVGERVGDATVTAISETSVLLRRGTNQIIILALSRAGTSSLTPQGPSAGAGPVSTASQPPSGVRETAPVTPPPPARPTPAETPGPAPLPNVSMVTIAVPAYAPLAPIGIPTEKAGTVPLFEAPVPVAAATTVSPSAPILPAGVSRYTPAGAPGARSTTQDLVILLAPPSPASSPTRPLAPVLPPGAVLYTPSTTGSPPSQFQTVPTP